MCNWLSLWLLIIGMLSTLQMEFLQWDVTDTVVYSVSSAGLFFFPPGACDEALEVNSEDQMSSLSSGPANKAPLEN